jgi:predicted O-methyltransferase YrrM
MEVLLPPNPATLQAAAMSRETVGFVLEVLNRLTVTDSVTLQKFFYTAGLVKFGENWRFAEILTTLRAAALLTQATTYLEIGVRRGRSAAMVAASAPQCQIYGFDLWIEGYAREENPGPDFVRQELRRAGHQGTIQLFSGDSKITVPNLLKSQPDLFFDLMLIDGDHSVIGAATDLANTLPRLKVGGIVVFDDLCVAPALQHVWQRLIRADRRYVSWEFTEAGSGVAAAVRIADGPVHDPLYWHADD